MFSWPLKACPLKWGAQSRASWNIYLQTVYIIKNNNDFYSSCNKQNFNMLRHPAMSEQNKKKIKTMYLVTIVNPDVSPTHRPMLHIFPINPRCLTVFLIHRFHRLIVIPQNCQNVDRITVSWTDGHAENSIPPPPYPPKTKCQNYLHYLQNAQ